MAKGGIQKYDIGTVFKVTFLDENEDIVNLSGAASKRLIFEKPDGTIVEKDAELFSDGTDGIATYTTISGDLDQTGVWYLQGLIEYINGIWKSDVKKFTVNENIE